MVSLDNFVTEKRDGDGKHPKCVTCNLPSEILSQVEEGRSSGYTYKVISEWLASNADEGLSYDIPTTTLTNHFRDNHHLGK